MHSQSKTYGGVALSIELPVPAEWITFGGTLPQRSVVNRLNDSQPTILFKPGTFYPVNFVWEYNISPLDCAVVTVTLFCFDLNVLEMWKCRSCRCSLPILWSCTMVYNLPVFNFCFRCMLSVVGNSMLFRRLVVVV